jgi:CRISPR system Cascade subunit CasE
VNCCDGPEKALPETEARFMLRANATRVRRREGRAGQRVDIVMDALFSLDRASRPAIRMDVARFEAEKWLGRQGEQSGFTLAPTDDGCADLAVADYSVLALPGYRGRRQNQPQFGILDMTGSITITDPATFLERLAQGFGRAKSFGCGLMMIRRH